MATNFEPHEIVNFVQSTKIGTKENKAIHSIDWHFFLHLHFSDLEGKMDAIWDRGSLVAINRDLRQK